MDGARSSCARVAVFTALLLFVFLAAGGSLVAATSAHANATSAPMMVGDVTAPLDCLAIGDSLTRDMFAVDLDNGYFPRLTAWLSANGMPKSDRLAISGSTVADALAQIGHVHEMQARLVVIELGSNDATDPGYAPPTPVLDFERDYRSLVAAVLAADPRTRLVLVGLWGQRDRRPVYDEIIRRIAADTGATFVELGELGDDPALRGPAGRLTPQGVADRYHPNDEGHGAIAQRLREAVARIYGLDATPPRTRADCPAGWCAHTVSLHLTARAGAAPVAETRFRVDGGEWRSGTALRVSPNGVHTVCYYSVDTRGDTETLRRCTVRIDRIPPTTKAVGTVRAVSGRPARLGIQLVDTPARTCLVRLEVLRAGHLILRRRIGRLPNGSGSVRWTCVVPPGRYRYRFTAVDPAGNRQSEALTARLIVR